MASKTEQAKIPTPSSDSESSSPATKMFVTGSYMLISSSMLMVNKLSVHFLPKVTLESYRTALDPRRPDVPVFSLSPPWYSSSSLRSLPRARLASVHPVWQR